MFRHNILNIHRFAEQIPEQSQRLHNHARIRVAQQLKNSIRSQCINDFRLDRFLGLEGHVHQRPAAVQPECRISVVREFAQQFDGARLDHRLLGRRELQQQIADGRRDDGHQFDRWIAGEQRHQRSPHGVVLKSGTQLLYGTGERVETAHGRQSDIRTRITETNEHLFHQTVHLNDSLADVLVVGAQRGQAAEGTLAGQSGGAMEQGGERRNQVVADGG